MSEFPTLPPYTVPEGDADIWQCGVVLTEEYKRAIGYKACTVCGLRFVSHQLRRPGAMGAKAHAQYVVDGRRYWRTADRLCAVCETAQKRALRVEREQKRRQQNQLEQQWAEAWQRGGDPVVVCACGHWTALDVDRVKWCRDSDTESDPADVPKWAPMPDVRRFVEEHYGHGDHQVRERLSAVQAATP